MNQAKRLAKIAIPSTLATVLLAGGLVPDMMAESAFAVPTDNTTITVNGKVDGHHFTAYKLASFGNVTITGGKATATVSSESAVKAKIASAAQTAGITVANGQDPADAVARESSSAKIQAFAKALAGAGLTQSAETDGRGSSATLNVTEGWYLVTDSKGLPMLVGTQIKSGNQTATAMKSGGTLGVIDIKSTSLSVDKKVNGSDNGSASVGSTIGYTVTIPMPDPSNVKTLQYKDTLTGGTITDTPTATIDGKAATISPQVNPNKSGFTVDLTGLLAGSKDKTLVISYHAKTTAKTVTNDAQLSGTTATDNQFTRTGYTFTGWNTKADGTGTAYHAGATIAYPAEGKTLTLYAQWKVSSHTVTFDSNGGHTVASQTVDDKGKVKEPTAPMRDSWTFAGWYLNGVKYDFTTPVTQDITLKAGWKRVAPSMEFKDMHKRISAGSKSGQQKLTLDVKGTGETNKSVTPSDVVILVDETNSMRECADGSSKVGSGIQCATGPSKRDNLGNIIDSAVTSILATNAGRSADQQSRISVIRFAGRNSRYPPKALSQFTTDKNVALPNGWNQGDDLYQTGTDWATALEHVGEAGNTRSNVNKQIILVTDGLASAANEDYAKAGTTANAALNIKDSATLQKAIKAYGYANQRTMTVTQSLAKAGWHLRVVGVSADASATALGDSYLAGAYPYVGKDGSMGFYKKGSQPSGYSSQIEWVASVAKNAGDSTAIGSDFEATDINNITSTLTSTVITSTTMWNTVISDPLSEWVDPVGLVDGKGTGITVSKDGKPMDSGYTAVYDGSSRTVKVSLPDSLADGSVYSVSFEVALSDKARSNYMQSGTYPDTGDADTGTTSAGKKGYSTNGNATLSWDAVTSTNGTPLIVSHKAKYAKPVTSYDSSNVPPVLTNKLPGTGGVAGLMPVFIGAGLALALAAAWIVRKHLARLP